VTTDRTIAQHPDAVAAAVRAIVKTQRALREHPQRATEVGRRLFPPAEAAMISDVVARDLPFYDPTISADVVAGVNQFAQDIGLLAAPVSYEQVVATQFRDLWTV
jgi:ABC-type nitrate/sulfonate/bicarbonate transport system substrate-binding protein